MGTFGFRRPSVFVYCIIVYMRAYQLPILILVLGSIVVSLHLVALARFWYWEFWWFDIPMHFFGGFLVSLFSFFIMRELGLSRFRNNRYSIFANVILCTVIVGLLWEIFELVFGLTLTKEHSYVVDTGADTVLNLTGAVVGYWYAVIACREQNNEQ